jgi:integrase/recombinase XerD
MSAINTSASAAPLLSEATPRFLAFATVELGFAPQTVAKYDECLHQVVRWIGDLPVTELSKQKVVALKSVMLGRRHSAGRQVCILAALKRLLLFCREELRLAVMEPDLIVLPKRPRREVVFLTPEEVERFVSVIDLYNEDEGPSEAGFRFRALVEVLLGTAMRISEALSLNREDIDFVNRDAPVIGKGNKQRSVFFTPRSLHWLQQYLSLRRDDHPAVFVTQGGGSRLSRTDIWRPFVRCRRQAQIAKRVTPHLLRHTAATQLLMNGCPIGHIKEILGHERLDTTCRYYLGLDRRAAKQAHQKYLVYDHPGPHPTTTPVGHRPPSHEFDCASMHS